MMFTKIKNICRYYWLLPENGEGRERRGLELGNICDRTEQGVFSSPASVHEISGTWISKEQSLFLRFFSFSSLYLTYMVFLFLLKCRVEDKPMFSLKQQEWRNL